jgi:hypothetical protein
MFNLLKPEDVEKLLPLLTMGVERGFAKLESSINQYFGAAMFHQRATMAMLALIQRGDPAMEDNEELALKAYAIAKAMDDVAAKAGQPGEEA